MIHTQMYSYQTSEFDLMMGKKVDRKTIKSVSEKDQELIVNIKAESRHIYCM